MALKTAIGLMSGTSMDGIDIALLRTDGKRHVERGPSGFKAYRPDEISKIEKSLLDAKDCKIRTDRPGRLADVETLITSLHVSAVRQFLADNHLTPNDVDLLGFHGQTVLHRPDEAMTIQLGDGARLAKETGIDCVYDMRANDMAHGGQGAPLAPVYHHALSKNLPEEHRKKRAAFVNVGGISNISFIGELEDQLVAFDSGPGNALIDQWVQAHVGIPYDQAGMIAAEGAVNAKLAEHFLSHSYFDQPLPKSLDRGDFKLPPSDSSSVEDGARTLAFVTAKAIFAGAELLPDRPQLWVMCGGGRHNPHIMFDLENLTSEENAHVVSAEAVGFDGDAMEAECWAYLAVRSALGLPLTFPGTTGVERPMTGGVLVRS